VNQPAENVTRRAEEGEALIARVHQRNWRADDAGGVARVIRMYFWVAGALQEAQWSVKRLRDVLCGAGRTPKTPPASEVSPSSSEVLGQGEGELVPGAAASPGLEAAGCAGGPGTSKSAASPRPTGGHRPGPGRLGAEADEGAERVECRHEELAVGQRCPVCGQGTVDALPPGSEMRIDGPALRRALR